MSKSVTNVLFIALSLLAAVAAQSARAEERKDANKGGMAIDLGKVMEADAKGEVGEPNYGYVGTLGSFVATKDSSAMGAIVVHHHPSTEKIALGCTKLTYEGTKRLGNVDGWVFKTNFDGKIYPSKIFFSANQVYFGGGVNAYIAADYREGTGWAWKLHPLRRMGLVKEGATAAAQKE